MHADFARAQSHTGSDVQRSTHIEGKVSTDGATPRSVSGAAATMPQDARCSSNPDTGRRNEPVGSTPAGCSPAWACKRHRASRQRPGRRATPGAARGGSGANELPGFWHQMTVAPPRKSRAATSPPPNSADIKLLGSNAAADMPNWDAGRCHDDFYFDGEPTGALARQGAVASLSRISHRNSRPVRGGCFVYRSVAGRPTTPTSTLLTRVLEHNQYQAHPQQHNRFSQLRV